MIFRTLPRVARHYVFRPSAVRCCVLPSSVHQTPDRHYGLKMPAYQIEEKGSPNTMDYKLYISKTIEITEPLKKLRLPARSLSIFRIVSAIFFYPRSHFFFFFFVLCSDVKRSRLIQPLDVFLNYATTCLILYYTHRVKCIYLLIYRYF